MKVIMAGPKPVPGMLHSKIAIIGGGFGALMTVSVLRFRGVPLSDICVYSDSGNPEGLWEKTVRAFRLTHMRSESLGHFYPTDSPGLASVEAVKTWSAKPLILSWFDAYHPTVDFFLEHTRLLARLVGYYRAIVRARVGRIAKNGNEFSIYNTNDQLIGTSQHLVIAVGHGSVIVPPAVAAYRAKYGSDSLVIHSFEEKEYAPPRRVLLVGDGLTSGTECANALQVGSTVYVLSRHGKGYIKQALNTPRHYFSRRGITPYREQDKQGRIAELKRATRGTIKPYFMWMKLFTRAERTGQLQYVRGELTGLTRSSATTITAIIRLTDGHTILPLMVDQVIVATGFQPASTNPLWQQLIRDFKLTLHDNYIDVGNDFCLNELSTPGSFAAVIGPAAAWAIPSSDSLGGMKIVAHAIADLLVGHETWSPRQVSAKLLAWSRLILEQTL